MLWSELTKQIRRTQPEKVTEELRSEERKYIEQWWRHRVGDRGLLTWDDLNYKQRILLSGWFLLSRAPWPRPQPNGDEELPIECESPLMELSIIVDGHVKRPQFHRNNLQVPLVHGRARKCKVRKKRSGLAT